MPLNLARYFSRSDPNHIGRNQWIALAGGTALALLTGMQVPIASAGPTFPNQINQQQSAGPTEPVQQRPAAEMTPVQPPDAGAAPRPYRQREEIEADLQNLEAERVPLLAKYASAHPDVRAVDRRLQILRKQLDMLAQATKATP